MAYSQGKSTQPTNPDLLAAVVLDTLVRVSPQALKLDQTAVACERDPECNSERLEIERALQSLQEDGLAQRRDGGFAATRAATRADALRF